MKTRLALTLTALVVFAAACGTDPAADGGVRLRYSYAPGDSVSYEVHHTMTTTLAADGDAALLGDNLDLSMSMEAATRVDYAISEGPDPDTTAMHITATFLDGTATVTPKGQPETALPIDDLADMASVDLDLVVGPTGEILSLGVAGQDIPLGLFGDSLTGIFGQGFQPPNIGPILPVDPVAVGSTWRSDQSIDMYGISLQVSGDHAVTAEEDIAGRVTMKIESTLVMSPVDADLLEVLTGLIASADLAGIGADPAELQAALGMLQELETGMQLHLGETTTAVTTWFDPAAGLVVKMDSSSTPMTMTLALSNLPDTEGDLTVRAELTTSQTMQLAG